MHGYTAKVRICFFTCLSIACLEEFAKNILQYQKVFELKKEKGIILRDKKFAST